VPEALPDDGILDFLVVREVTRLKFLQIVGKYAKGRFREYKDIITHIRGDYMKIEGENELAVNVDGELILTKAISFRIIPRSINFIFPSV
jgi:diacylglycerol kinase family enzyme